IVPGFLEQLGRMQQRLRWNAADVEAGAAEGLVLLDHRGLEPELRRADRADVAAGTAADDDEIVGHDEETPIKSSCPGLSPPSTSSFVGWVERSETHQVVRRSFRRWVSLRSTHPTKDVDGPGKPRPDQQQNT